MEIIKSLQFEAIRLESQIWELFERESVIMHHKLKLTGVHDTEGPDRHMRIILIISWGIVEQACKENYDELRVE